MSEYCLNCEATERKLDFYVEQFKKMEDERDRWREIAGNARNALSVLKTSITGTYYIGEEKEIETVSKALALFPKEPSDNG